MEGHSCQMLHEARNSMANSVRSSLRDFCTSAKFCLYLHAAAEYYMLGKAEEVFLRPCPCPLSLQTCMLLIGTYARIESCHAMILVPLLSLVSSVRATMHMIFSTMRKQISLPIRVPLGTWQSSSVASGCHADRRRSTRQPET